MLGRAATGVEALARASARAGVRASAVDEIRTVATRLAEAHVPVFRPFDWWKARLAAPNLLPVGAADAVRAAEDLRGLLRWVDDGNCFSRGVVGAARMDELLGGAGTGAGDAVRAAVAVVNTSQRKTGWVMHAATAFRMEGDDTVRIVDHLLGARTGNAAGIFTIDEWASHVGRRASDVRIQSILDNVPVGGPITRPSGAGMMRMHARRLVSSIRDA